MTGEILHIDPRYGRDYLTIATENLSQRQVIAAHGATQHPDMAEALKLAGDPERLALMRVRVSNRDQRRRGA